MCIKLTSVDVGFCDIFRIKRGVFSCLFFWEKGYVKKTFCSTRTLCKRDQNFVWCIHHLIIVSPGCRYRFSFCPFYLLVEGELARFLSDYAFKHKARLSSDKTYRKWKALSKLSQFPLKHDLFLCALQHQHIYPQHIYLTKIKGDGTKKKSQKGGRAQWAIVWHKTKSTLYHTERGREAKAPEYCSQKAKLPCVCVCVYAHTIDNPAVWQPADRALSGSTGGRWRWGARAPSCAFFFFFFNEQSSVDLEQRICWWHAEGSDSDTGVCPVTRSLYTTVPRLHNKLKK